MKHSNDAKAGVTDATLMLIKTETIRVVIMMTVMRLGEGERSPGDDIPAVPYVINFRKQNRGVKGTDDDKNVKYTS